MSNVLLSRQCVFMFHSKLYVTDLIPDAIICGVLSRSALAVECRTLHIFHNSHKRIISAQYITPFSHDTNTILILNQDTGENRSGIALATNLSLWASLSIAVLYFSQTLSLIFFLSLSYCFILSFSLSFSFLFFSFFFFFFFFFLFLVRIL